MSMDSEQDQEPLTPSSARPRVSSGRPWIYFTVILCCYAFFKEFKPSEAFLTPYLVDSKNFTKDEVNSEIYPYWPYSYLVASLFIFLFTDFLRYKPVILLEAFSYLATRFLLIWGTSVFSMQWMQVAYGVASASEVAFFAYIYLAVPDVRFKIVTSLLRAIRLLGQSGSSAVAQVVTSTGAFTLLQLNYISFASVLVACVFALLIPNPISLPCEPTWARGVISIVHAPQRQARRSSLKGFIICALKDFKKFYSNPVLLKWSVWWAFSMCGVLQVGNYVQSLWKKIAEDADQSHQYNGLVEALAQLCSALAALTISALKINWALWGETVIGALCMIDAVMLVIASHSLTVWIAYICHILYRTTYSFLITIASIQLAYAVDHDSYGLIFGFNTFLSLVLMTALTLTVADEHGLDLDIRTQFVVYGGYYYFLSLLFIGAGVYTLTRTGWLNSICLFRSEGRPPSLATITDAADDIIDEIETDPTEDNPLIQAIPRIL